MTIQFHCQYCTAAIEVEDAAAGKAGQCPKCGARVSVPRPAGIAAETSAATPDPMEEPAPEVAEPVPAPVDVFQTPPALVGALPDPTRPSTTGSVARRVKRRSRRGGSWLIPGIFMLLFLGVGVWLAAPQFEWDSLTGELPGELVGHVDFDPAILSCKDSPLPDRQVAGLLEDLQHEPINLTSELMQIQIRGEPEGLSFSIGKGRKTNWYRVDAQAHRALSRFVTRQHASLNQARVRDVTQARDNFLNLQLRLQAGREESPDLRDYRDRLALPALTGGLGYHVAAKVGNTVYRCVRETDDGSLYFLLPPGIKEFQLTGRPLADGTTAFSGDFVVKVTVPLKLPDESLSAEPANPEPTAESMPMDEATPPMAEPE